jgi:hypothetical protein
MDRPQNASRPLALPPAGKRAAFVQQQPPDEQNNARAWAKLPVAEAPVISRGSELQLRQDVRIIRGALAPEADLGQFIAAPVAVPVAAPFAEGQVRP